MLRASLQAQGALAMPSTEPGEAAQDQGGGRLMASMPTHFGEYMSPHPAPPQNSRRCAGCSWPGPADPAAPPHRTPPRPGPASTRPDPRRTLRESPCAVHGEPARLYWRRRDRRRSRAAPINCTAAYSNICRTATWMPTPGPTIAPASPEGRSGRISSVRPPAGQSSKTGCSSSVTTRERALPIPAARSRVWVIRVTQPYPRRP